MAAATLVGAQAEAMKSAAANENGAVAGFMGYGMAANAGGINAQNLFAMGAQAQAASANGWKCACGAVNNGNFCSECGAKKPSASCAKCGYKPEDPNNPPKFCPECGEKF